MSKDQWASFHTTHWSLVDGAAHIDSQRKRQALTELIKRYLPPLKSHLIFRKHLDGQRAEDILQDFLYSKVLEQDLFARAQKERGKFRTFILTALDRFLISQLRHDSAAKRSSSSNQSLDENLPIADTASAPDEQFEINWARQVLAEAQKRMELECRSAGRLDVWEVYKGRIATLLEQDEMVGLQELASRHQLPSTVQVSNLLVTAKRAFARCLRSVVGEYEKEAAQIDAEIADLRRIFARSRKR